MIEIAPSILSADFARLAEALALAERGGAGAIHVDMMDGHFVPNLTIGPPVVRSLRKATRLPLDCHLMIERPGEWIAACADAGADRLTVHAEAEPHLQRAVRAIRDRGLAAGVALNPATPLGVLDEILPELDQVLVMSVNPGFSGQAFWEPAVDKVARLAERIRGRGLEVAIQVDGGVGPGTIRRLVEAGATRFVAGNAVYGRDDPVAALRELRDLAGGVTR